MPEPDLLQISSSFATVPKLCLGMQLRAELDFAWNGCLWVRNRCACLPSEHPRRAKQSFAPKGVLKRSLGPSAKVLLHRNLLTFFQK